MLRRFFQSIWAVIERFMDDAPPNEFERTIFNVIWGRLSMAGAR